MFIFLYMNIKNARQYCVCISGFPKLIVHVVLTRLSEKITAQK